MDWTHYIGQVLNYDNEGDNILEFYFLGNESMHPITTLPVLAKAAARLEKRNADILEAKHERNFFLGTNYKKS